MTASNNGKVIIDHEVVLPSMADGAKWKCSEQVKDFEARLQESTKARDEILEQKDRAEKRVASLEAALEVCHFFGSKSKGNL